MTHLCHSISDHCLILVNTVGHRSPVLKMRIRYFWFSADWCLKPNCEQIIGDFWRINHDVVPKKFRGFEEYAYGLECTSLEN